MSYCNAFRHSLAIRACIVFFDGRAFAMVAPLQLWLAPKRLVINVGLKKRKATILLVRNLSQNFVGDVEVRGDGLDIVVIL